MKKISILGATGSIGTQTLDIIRNDKENYRLICASANSNYEKIINIIKEFKPRIVALMDDDACDKVRSFCLENKLNTNVLLGIEGLNAVATCDEVDMVVTSVVGMVGLVPTLKAIEAGKNIALANKETLVAGGHLVIDAAKRNNVNILPVDSEHGAIFQCLQGNEQSSINKIILTASGGPFRGKKKYELENIRPEDALKHPKWNMGKKISIDSSTLMNKGLEVIEAHWLFNVDYSNIEVIVHPQSIVHSMVEYNDGSIIAQLGDTDMKLPIQYAINYPKRCKRIVKQLDLNVIGSLTFEKPDMETFKCLKLAYESGEIGGNMPTILNSANEAAVNLYLENKISYLQIEQIIEECLNKFEFVNNPSLEEIIYIDSVVKDYINNKMRW